MGSAGWDCDRLVARRGPEQQHDRLVGVVLVVAVVAGVRSERPGCASTGGTELGCSPPLPSPPLPSGRAGLVGVAGSPGWGLGGLQIFNIFWPHRSCSAPRTIAMSRMAFAKPRVRIANSQMQTASPLSAVSETPTVRFLPGVRVVSWRSGWSEESSAGGPSPIRDALKPPGGAGGFRRTGRGDVLRGSARPGPGGSCLEGRGCSRRGRGSRWC